MAVYANHLTQAAAEGTPLQPGAREDTSIAANMVRAMGRTVSPQPEAERLRNLPPGSAREPPEETKKAEAQSR